MAKNINDARLEAMKAIAAANAERDKAEHEAQGAPFDPNKEAAEHEDEITAYRNSLKGDEGHEEHEPDAEELARQEAERVAAQEAAAAAAAPAKVKVKVDGVEEEVEVDYMRSQYQKLLHADREAERIGREKREFEAQRQALLAQQQQFLDFQKERMKELEQGQAKAPTPSPSQEDAANKAVEDIMSGDAHEAKASLANLINSTVQAELQRRMAEETARLKEEATAQARAEIERVNTIAKWEKAVLTAQAQNPQIFEDKDLALLWETRFEAAARENLSPEESMSKANEALSGLMAKFKAPEPQQQENKQRVEAEELRKIEERKAAAKKFDVGGGNSVVAAPKQKETAMTHAQIIEAMRQQRSAVKQHQPRAK